MSFAAEQRAARRVSGPAPRKMRDVKRSSDARRVWTHWRGPTFPLLVVSGLLCLGIANISARATWHAVEDGVLWTTQPDGIVAADIGAGTPAATVGIKRGDLLLAIDDRPVQQMSDVVQMLQTADAGQTVRYTILRLGTREVVDVRSAPIPSGPRALYFLLSGMMDRFHYLGTGLALILIFVGAKMCAAPFLKIPSLVSLGVIALVLAGSVAVSLLRPPKKKE